MLKRWHLKHRPPYKHRGKRKKEKPAMMAPGSRRKDILFRDFLRDHRNLKMLVHESPPIMNFMETLPPPPPYEGRPAVQAICEEEMILDRKELEVIYEENEQRCIQQTQSNMSCVSCGEAESQEDMAMEVD